MQNETILSWYAISFLRWIVQFIYGIKQSSTLFQLFHNSKCWWLPYVSLANQNSNYKLQAVYHINTSFNGVEFKLMPKSFYSHADTFGLGNYRGNGFTTGCSPSGSDWKQSNRKTEIFDMENLTWYNVLDAPDYPFATDSEYVVSQNKFYRRIDC